MQWWCGQWVAGAPGTRLGAHQARWAQSVGGPRTWGEPGFRSLRMYAKNETEDRKPATGFPAFGVRLGGRGTLHVVLKINAVTSRPQGSWSPSTARVAASRRHLRQGLQSRSGRSI